MVAGQLKVAGQLEVEGDDGGGGVDCRLHCMTTEAMKEVHNN